MKVNGSCHCGDIAFEAEVDPERATICHCTDCQTLSGSAFRTSIPAQDGSFRLVSGEPRIYVKTAESGNKRAQAFCPRCGTAVYATSPGDGPKIYNLRLAVMRQRDALVPKRQIWTRSQQRWLAGLGAIRSFDRQS